MWNAILQTFSRQTVYTIEPVEGKGLFEEEGGGEGRLEEGGRGRGIVIGKGVGRRGNPSPQI